MEQRSRKEVEHIHTKDEKTGTKETRPNATRDSDTEKPVGSDPHGRPSRKHGFREASETHGRPSRKHGFREASEKCRRGESRVCHCGRCYTKTKTDDSQN